MGTNGAFLSAGAFILLLALTFIALIAIHTVFKRITGWSVPPLFQAVLIWLAAYGVFKYLLQPAMPSTLLYTYMGITTVGILMFTLFPPPSIVRIVN